MVMRRPRRRRRVCERTERAEHPIDLAKLTFIDSSGVRTLLALRDELGDRLTLGRLSPQAHRILELTGHSTTFRRNPGHLASKVMS